MNEVEKMYRNAHVYPRVYGDITKETFENKAFNMADMCNEAFTAEKQLNLIKWIAEYKEECRITYEKEYKWCTQTDWQSSFCYDNFSASLANLINTLWQDLTEEERKQIKEILE